MKSLRGGETRATMSPVEFTGETARAYQIAKEIPEVLDSMYCYCECEKHFAHKSLLSCYVDDHAAHCDICMNEAFMAYELHRQGKDIKSIRAAVDARFSH
ncbi:MAG TPA: CYCXC family (seleno)protein [Thermodesulfobacteriota bacterium]|nr:CYCXC family (seleno)protein [Thermodesulfobacteriota bacterium]